MGVEAAPLSVAAGFLSQKQALLVDLATILILDSHIVRRIVSVIDYHVSVLSNLATVALLSLAVSWSRHWNAGVRKIP